jgi:hypothetical protein
MSHLVKKKQGTWQGRKALLSPDSITYTLAPPLPAPAGVSSSHMAAARPGPGLSPSSWESHCSLGAGMAAPAVAVEAATAMVRLPTGERRACPPFFSSVPVAWLSKC